MSLEPKAPATPHRASPCIEVTTLWDDLVLEVRHLTPPCRLWLSEPTGRSQPHGAVVVPAGTIGTSPLCVLDADRRAEVTLLVRAGLRAVVRDAVGAALEPQPEAGAALAPVVRRVSLRPGMDARLEIGRLVVRLRVTTRPGRIARAAWRPGLRTVGLAASVLLHLALGGCSYYARSTAAADGELTDEQRYLIQHYLDGAAEHEQVATETEPIDQEAVRRAGGAGTRAKGAQGAMGSPRSSLAANHYGARGPADAPDAHLGRSDALREAAEFGMIGLLGSGAGGDPAAPSAPWGRDDALGSSPSGTRGSGWGLATGQGAGTGSGQGFGAGGIGLGGGGTAGRHGRSPLAPGLGSSAAPWPTIVEAPTDERPIDPNGRFATTYRPGKGHLAAFDAAMARGVVPPSARELVSDVGASYTPAIELSSGRALGYRLELERAALAPGGGSIHLRVALRASGERAPARQRLSVHVALDCSGSMAGEPMVRAKEAAAHLVRALAPDDEFSLTTFANDATVVVPAGPVGKRRPAIEQAIAATGSGGMTNIGEALTASYAAARARATAGDVVPVVMLLSDGQPTAGIQNRVELAFLALEAFQAGIQTSTFGLGSSFDPSLMSSIASDGAGGYYYLRSADQIADAFQAELRQRLEPAATGVEVRVRLASDVSLLGVYGSRRLDARESAVERAKEVAADVQAERRSGIARDRQQDRQGGMRFFIPAFAREDGYSLLVKLAVPPGVGPRSLGHFELRYKDRLHGKNVGEESPIFVSYAKSDAESAASLSPSVARTIQGHLAGRDLLSASNLLARGEREAAIELIRERQQLLVSAATRLDEPGLRTDAARFTRLLGVLRGDEALGEPFAVAMVLETAARSHLQ